MNAWFLRANGETAHNVPGSKHFVRGEPPTFPRREFNYRTECLEGGFARVGWPATGDLRAENWREVAARAYGDVMPARWVRNLERFANIRVGDIVVMPADREPYDVHLGVVVAGREILRRRPGAHRTPTTSTSRPATGSRTPIVFQCAGTDMAGEPGRSTTCRPLAVYGSVASGAFLPPKPSSWRLLRRRALK